MISKYQKMVAEFNKAIEAKPDVSLRVKLIQEEAEEFITAVKAKNLVETIDALCDLLYVLYGAADVFAMELDTAEDEEFTPSNAQPRWADLQEEIIPFDSAVSDTVFAFRHNMEDVEECLEALAGGCWVCGAEAVGIDLRPFFEEVHRTNMLKLTGPKREDGKQLKPEGWEPPRIAEMYAKLDIHGTN